LLSGRLVESSPCGCAAPLLLLRRRLAVSKNRDESHAIMMQPDPEDGPNMVDVPARRGVRCH
jgi:hypothetical protein